MIWPFSFSLRATGTQYQHPNELERFQVTLADKIVTGSRNDELGAGKRATGRDCLPTEYLLCE